MAVYIMLASFCQFVSVHVLIKWICSRSAVWLDFSRLVLQVSQLNTWNVGTHVLSVYDVPKLSDTTHKTYPLSSPPHTDDKSFPTALKP